MQCETTLPGSRKKTISQRSIFREHEKLRQFVADASHELRTPITAISGYSNLYLSGGTPDDASLRRAMHRIATESERMSTLVAELLFLARLDARQPHARTLVNLSSVVNDVLEDARLTQPERHIEAQVAPDTQVLMSDAHAYQIISNVVRNAFVHTPQIASVSVSLDTENGSAVFSVRDTGPGIPSEHQARIFDRFYRVDPSRTRATGGSGLGLAIVASITEMYSGQVSLESAAGEGTAITVQLPAVP